MSQALKANCFKCLKSTGEQQKVNEPAVKFDENMKRYFLTGLCSNCGNKIHTLVNKDGNQKLPQPKKERKRKSSSSDEDDSSAGKVEEIVLEKSEEQPKKKRQQRKQKRKESSSGQSSSSSADASASAS